MTLTTTLILEIGLVGLIAGVIGGLAGIGGSMVMLPALHFLLGEPRHSTHHMYMAAAMTVNAAVSFPAALRHHRSGAVRFDLLPPLLLSTAVFIVIGVLSGNLFTGLTLRYALAIFIGAYCVHNTLRLIQGPRPPAPELERTGRTRLALSGAATGFVGGVLGLGGGVLLVPMLQVLCNIRLRQAIATSSAVICMTAIVGAGVKLSTLGREGESARDALLIAAALAPTAIVGGVIGATLTHRLPVRAVRAIVTVLLLAAAARLAGFWA